MNIYYLFNLLDVCILFSFYQIKYKDNTTHTKHFIYS